MIEIILEASKARTAPNFLIKDIPGTTGRWDVVIRCLRSAFSFPREINEKINFTVLLGGLPDPPKLFKFEGSIFNDLRNEILGAVFFRDLVKKSMKIMKTTEISPGIEFSRINLIRYLDRKLKNGEVVFYLSENGFDINKFLTSFKMNFTQKLNFIIGDQSGFRPELLKYLSKISKKLKLKGNKSYLSSQSIKYLIFELLKLGIIKH
ncbi:MAG: hypothetical protein EU549_00060 [Promethearchaeota archaeon]|nr:MAG: hypothetical protein EU549_00060 [Candidatus Lokiarchaeota archaeon]